MSQLKNAQFTNNRWAAQHWCSWEAFYLFGQEIGVKYKDDDLAVLNAWGSISESTCWWAPWEGICIMSDRARHVSFDENKRLHNETKKSVEFSDGWGIYSWHGVAVPENWIMDKKSLTPQIALTWSNVEQRRCACEILGWHNVLEHESLNPKVIDIDMPHIGTLIEVDLPDAPKQRFIKYQCGTGRYFAESVNDKSFDTALKANAGGNGWRPGFGEPDNFIPFLRS